MNSTMAKHPVLTKSLQKWSNSPRLCCFKISVTCCAAAGLRSHFHKACSVPITLFKDAGDCSDCNNCWVISLLSEFLERCSPEFFLPSLRAFAERVLPESQLGFGCNRSTSHVVFSVRRLQEKRQEQNKSFNVAFVDLKNNFNLVGRKSLFKILDTISCPQSLSIWWSRSKSTWHQLSARMDNQLRHSICSAVSSRVVFALTHDLCYVRSRVTNTKSSLTRHNYFFPQKQ